MSDNEVLKIVHPHTHAESDEILTDEEGFHESDASTTTSKLTEIADRQANFNEFENSPDEFMDPARHALHLPIPTDVHHTQAASAIAVSNASQDGSLVLVCAYFNRVFAYRLPTTAGLTRSSTSHSYVYRNNCAGIDSHKDVAPVFYGGFSLPDDALSVAVHPSGKYFVVACEGGILMIYTIDPLQVPHPAANAYFPPSTHQLEFQSIDGYFPSPKKSHRESRLGMLSEDMLCGLEEHVVNGYYDNNAYSYLLDRQLPEDRYPKHTFAGVEPLWYLIHIGVRPPHAHIFANGESMLNGVSFGLVKGRERMIISDQFNSDDGSVAGHVLILELPKSDVIQGTQLNDILCDPAELEGMAVKKRYFVGSKVVPESALGCTFDHAGQVPRYTAALGPFKQAVNYAAASPDGRYIAVCTDSEVVLLDQEHDFVQLKLCISTAEPSNDAAFSSQYCAWNASSTLLAATSDSRQMCFAWSLKCSGKEVGQALQIDAFRPCLGVKFAPWDDTLLFFHEEAKGLFACRLDANVGAADSRPALESIQYITIDEQSAARFHEKRYDQYLTRRCRITGMVATDNYDLLVATRQGLISQLPVTIDWTTGRHKSWPVAFRECVKVLLLGNMRRDSILNILDKQILLRVFNRAAGNRLDWLL